MITRIYRKFSEELNRTNYNPCVQYNSCEKFTYFAHSLS